MCNYELVGSLSIWHNSWCLGMRCLSGLESELFFYTLLAASTGAMTPGVKIAAYFRRSAGFQAYLPFTEENLGQILEFSEAVNELWSLTPHD